MPNNESIKHNNIGVSAMPNYEDLRESLLKVKLDDSTISDVIDAVKAAIETDQVRNQKENVSSSSPNGKFPLKGITVITLDGNIPSQCSRIVTVFAKEQKKRVKALTLKKALQSLTDYYTNCLPITKLGVLITDVWRPSEIWAFKGALDFYENNGIPTIIILKSNTNVYLLNFPWR